MWERLLEVAFRGVTETSRSSRNDSEGYKGGSRNRPGQYGGIATFEVTFPRPKSQNVLGIALVSRVGLRPRPEGVLVALLSDLSESPWSVRWDCDSGSCASPFSA
jgi:hypothetical protein